MYAKDRLQLQCNGVFIARVLQGFPGIGGRQGIRGPYGPKGFPGFPGFPGVDGFQGDEVSAWFAAALVACTYAAKRLQILFLVKFVFSETLALWLCKKHRKNT